MDIEKYDKERSLKQSNNFTVSRYKLDTLEQRLMFAICSQQPRNGEHFEKIRLPISVWADAIGVTSENKYATIRALSNKLMRRLVTIPTCDGGEYTSHWIQSRRYYAEDASIEFNLDPDLKEEFLNLRRAYVDAPLNLLMSFTSSYAARLYLILRKMLKIGDFEYDLDFFRKQFELGKAYQRLNNLKNRVFEPALNEINVKSDINVKWDYIKEGRSYKKIHFVVSAKREIKKAIAAAPTETKNEPTDEEKELLARLTNPKKWNITKVRAEQILKKYGVDHVRKNLLYADKYRSGKTNLGGWLVDCIRNDYAADERARKAEQERERVKKHERDESKFKPIVPTPPVATETKNKRAGNAGALAWLAKNQV